MGNKKAAALLKDLTFLKESGIEVGEDLFKFTQWQDWDERGILQVWACPCQTYESELRIKGMVCGKGHQMKVIYPL